MDIPAEIERLKKELEETGDEATRVQILEALFKNYVEILTLDQQPYAEKLMQTGTNLGDAYYTALGSTWLAVSYIKQARCSEALELLHPAKEVLQQGDSAWAVETVYNSIGLCYSESGDFSTALKYFEQGIIACHSVDTDYEPIILYHNLAHANLHLNNYQATLQWCQKLASLNLTGARYGLMGRVYHNIGMVQILQFKLAEPIENTQKALTILRECGDISGSCEALTNIGWIYDHQGLYAEALQNHQEVLRLSEEHGFKKLMAAAYANIGYVHEQQENYQEALETYLRALKLLTEQNIKELVSGMHCNIGGIYALLTDKCAAGTPERGSYYELSIKHNVLALETSINRRETCEAYNALGTTYQKQANDMPAGAKREALCSEALAQHLKAIAIGEEIEHKKHIAMAYEGIGRVYAQQNDYLQAKENYLTAIQIAEDIGDKKVVCGLLLALFSIYKSLNDFEQALIYHEKHHKLNNELIGAEAQKKLSQLHFKQDMENKEKEISFEKKEREITQTLVLNILPAEVAEELRDTGESEARQFDDVTVLFTDFKSFTTVSERLTPKQLVAELHACFSAFDGIMQKYEIEKIKTVGDAYLAASGLPHANPNHATNMVRAAQEVRDFMHRRQIAAKDNGLETFEIRIGIHSGPVVAGIVGVKKFAYDIWGDTVNTAARMEQNSEAGRINISEVTYQLIKGSFTCEYRGEIEAKNKGKLRMYFVE